MKCEICGNFHGWIQQQSCCSAKNFRYFGKSKGGISFGDHRRWVNYDCGFIWVDAEVINGEILNLWWCFCLLCVIMMLAPTILCTLVCSGWSSAHLLRVPCTFKYVGPNGEAVHGKIYWSVNLGNEMFGNVLEFWDWTVVGLLLWVPLIWLLSWVPLVGVWIPALVVVMTGK